MPRRPIVLLIVFLAVAVLLIGSRVRDQSPVSAVAPQPDMSSNAAPETATVPAAVDAAAKTSALLDQLANGAEPAMTIPPQAMALAPLPSWDAKLVDVLPELRARADAGDHVAACHIGLALSACAVVGSHQPSAAELRAINQTDTEGLEIAAGRSSDSWRPGREATCAGLGVKELSIRFAYLQQAADAGHIAAMSAYAEGVPLWPQEAAIRNPEWLDAHRQRAPRYVAELVRRGDGYIAFLLAETSDGLRMSPLSQALRFDQQTAATFWFLSRYVLAKPDYELHDFPPEVNLSARDRGMALYQKYYASKPFSSGELSRRRDVMRVEHCTELR